MERPVRPHAEELRAVRIVHLPRPNVRPERRELRRVLVDDVELCGGYCVWLTKEKREWLSGRYVCSEWDTDELENMKDEIVKGDKLRFTMDV